MVLKPQIKFKSKPAITTADKAQNDPPSLKSYGKTSEKTRSARVLWQMSAHFEEACDELSRVVCNAAIGFNLRL